MGAAAQQSVCFRYFFKDSQDMMDEIPESLPPIAVKDIEYKEGIMSDFMGDAKCVIITNVASY
jgi:hypothetical protein